MKNLKKIIVFSFFIVLFQLTACLKYRNSDYSFFIEFNDAQGIKLGTPIRLRGIEIGSVQNIKLKFNCVLVAAKINSNNIVISKNSIIETNQTGLLNESVVDITPLDFLQLKKDDKSSNPVSSFCDSSSIICNDMYIVGDRGLNYDDLVRSTTRISQRFDDPRFFHFFYVFLQNSIELTDIILDWLTLVLEILPINHVYVH